MAESRMRREGERERVERTTNVQDALTCDFHGCDPVKLRYSSRIDVSDQCCRRRRQATTVPVKCTPVLHMITTGW